MLRSLYSGVSGVKSHQTYLDVTGNNIANANTVGFKRDVLQFRDMIYQTMSGASGPGDGLGGINPVKVGLGVKVGSIETIHTGGSLQSTGNPTDMAIQGDGYFVIQNGNQQLFTRAGNFAMDRDGNMVMSGTGGKVQGYAYKDQVDPETGNVIRKKASNLTDINIPIGQKIPAKATTLAGFRCNLCSSSADVGDGPLRSYNRKYNPKAVTYVGTDEPGAPAVNDTWFNGVIVQCRDNTNAWVPCPNAPAPNTVPTPFFYGRYTDANAVPGLERFWSQPVTPADPTNPQVQGVLVDTTKVVEVDGVVTVAPTVDATNRMDYAGKTFLNTENGELYTYPPAPSCPTDAWFPVTVPVASAANTVYTVKEVKGTPKDINMYVRTLTAGTPIMGTYTHVMDSKTHKVYSLGSSEPNGADIIQYHHHETKMDVFDSLGNRYTMATYFQQTAKNEWNYYTCFLDKEGKEITELGSSIGSFSFGDDGLLNKESYVKKEINAKFSVNGAEDSVITLDFLGKDMEKAIGVDKEPIDGVTQFSSPTTTKGYYQDGYTMGELNSWTVGGDGIITGSYTNGKLLPISQVALATFANPAGLTKTGDTCFAVSANSGMPQIGGPGTGGAGKIVGGNIEMSNVDLSEEFVNLIRAQRGFQASTRVVTTSDQVLEELINMKR